jgi:hypothetical protein
MACRPVLFYTQLDSCSQVPHSRDGGQPVDRPADWGLFYPISFVFLYSSGAIFILCLKKREK